MAYILWTDTLRVGIRDIDEQHRQLLDMVNALHDQSLGSVAQCPSPELLKRLEEYAEQHFHIEEGYMQAFAYPELEAHLKEHEGFRAAIATFKTGCADGSAHPAELLEFLKSWITNHILDVDMKMGRFLEDFLR